MEIPRFCALCLLITVFYVTRPVHCARGSSLIESGLEPNQERNNIVKTIKTEYGDIYDCVGLYKQPAFDNPLLKHHKIQMKPSFAPKNEVWEKNSSSINSLTFGLKEACPSGTVPIRRVTQEEKLRAEAAFLQRSQLFSASSPQNDGQVLAFAGAASRFTRGAVEVHGAGGSVSVHNPAVDMQQVSGSVIAVEYGDNDDEFATIRVGWVVDPGTYNGDTHTRLFSLWSQHSDGGAHTGCLNTYCPGFVQTNPNIPLDSVLDPVSPPQGQQRYISQELEWDRDTGNWWYRLGPKKEALGYWPSEIFKVLNHGAAQKARFGGFVVSNNAQMFPDMGSGETDDANGCHFKSITGVKPTNSDTNTPLFLKLKNNTNNGSETNWHIPITVVETNCYKVGGDVHQMQESWGLEFWFGGKGGTVDQCKN